MRPNLMRAITGGTEAFLAPSRARQKRSASDYRFGRSTSSGLTLIVQESGTD